MVETKGIVQESCTTKLGERFSLFRKFEMSSFPSMELFASYSGLFEVRNPFNDAIRMNSSESVSRKTSDIPIDASFFSAIK
jgi:hypothetical protein